MSADATVVIVAQRISTVAAADQIIVIDDGKVVGTGTHESLLADCPTYAEFADSQTVGAGVGGGHDRSRWDARSAAWCRRRRNAPATSRAPPSGW